jgi:ATP-dependent protease ClpP protease subunit
VVNLIRDPVVKLHCEYMVNIPAFSTISKERGNTNVIVYGSAFLQKPQVPPFFTMVTSEDLNGFMNNLVNMDTSKGLTLILHTPGGEGRAVEPIVGYLRSKFEYIEVIVPTYCMSAGTMIALSSNKLIMGRQSQIGQIDPQIPVNGGMMPATAIIQQFDKARQEIVDNPKTALAWNPILRTMGPALIETCEEALRYSKRIVSDYLINYMLSGNDKREDICDTIVNVLSHGDEDKNNHSRRIDRNEARDLGIIIEDLEDNQTLQDATLSLYHLFTLIFETTAVAKVITSNTGKRWIKSIPQAPQMMPIIQQVKKPPINQGKP